jgi:hypothetical protein
MEFVILLNFTYTLINLKINLNNYITDSDNRRFTNIDEPDMSKTIKSMTPPLADMDLPKSLGNKFMFLK